MQAQRLLVERGKPDVVPDLVALAGDPAVDGSGLFLAKVGESISTYNNTEFLRFDSLAAGRTEVYGSPTAGTAWDIDVEAAAGELAVAKALGRYWAPADDPAADLRDGEAAEE